VLGIIAKATHTVQYPTSASAIGSALRSEGFPVPRRLETWSVGNGNEGDVKCNEETQHCLLTETNMMLVEISFFLILQAGSNEIVCELYL
jgi:hypothetical protein